MPLDYNTRLMNKVVVLLTDGDNSFISNNYNAYGQLSAGRVGTTNATTAKPSWIIKPKTFAIH